MFTWICPQCGREVPPSYTDCPDCAKTAAPGGTPEPPPPPYAAPPQPPPPQYALPPQAYPPPPPQYAPPQAYGQPPQGYAPPQYPPQQQPQYAPPPPQYAPPPPQYAAPPPPPQYAATPEPAPPAAAPSFYPPPETPLHAKLPTWLMALIFGVVFVGVVWGIYSLVGSSHGSGSNAAPSAAANTAAAPDGKVNPMQKFIEVAGVRFVEDPKSKEKVLARFVLINHSEADIPGLAGTVTVSAHTDRSQETAGSFAFNTNLGPFQSKEMSEPLSTTLKIYELPDWQFVHTDVQITGPQ